MGDGNRLLRNGFKLDLGYAGLFSNLPWLTLLQTCGSFGRSLQVVNVPKVKVEIVFKEDIFNQPIA